MVSVVTLPPAVLPILSSVTHTSLSNHCGCVCVCVRSQMVVAPSVLPESTLNLCCVFLCICVFIKSVWWSTIVCRLRLCACVFLIIKVILWFGGCFQTVCFASLYVCMASSLLPAINFPSRVSEPILAEDLSQHHIMLTLIQHNSPSSSLWIWMDWCLDEGTPAKDLHF